MPVRKVSVKWSGKKFDVELDTDEPALAFKGKVSSLTGVTPDRQKIMIKGGLLKDDTDLNALNVQDGHSFMMMGTAGELPKAPEKPVVFMEDMTDAELAAVTDVPAGLQNLGNTCYMNATLQCLRTIPELQDELSTYQGGVAGMDQQGNLTAALRDLYTQLGRTTDGFPPMVFLQMLRSLFPQFAQMSNGIYAQQDAHECWSQIILVLKNKLRSSSEAKSFVDRYMTGDLFSTFKCDEDPNEPAATSIEKFTSLKCHIRLSVNFMVSGIKESLDEKIEKISPSLGRTAVYSKTSRVCRLPKYLAVDFLRFYWKQDSRVRAKIMRKVKFPVEFDASELCTPELQEKMALAKRRVIALDEERANSKRIAKGPKVSISGTQLPPADIATGPVVVAQPMSPEPPSPAGAASAAFQDVLRQKALERKKPLSEIIHPDLAADEGCNPHGQYELCAVLTHIGRSSDSGHYMAWTKKSDDEWFKFDDDKVSVVKAEEIMKLDGGGDWHMAYLLLYRAKHIE